jgi:hypothetical protein
MCLKFLSELQYSFYTLDKTMGWISQIAIYFLQFKETTGQEGNNEQPPVSWNLLKRNRHLRQIINMKSSKDI